MIRGLVAFGQNPMASAMRLLTRAGVAVAVTIGLAGCFTIPAQNPSYPATTREIDADLSRMVREPVRLERPVLVLSGYRSPHPVASRLAERLRELTGAERQEMQSLAYIWSGTVEEPARKAVARVEELWPSDDPDWTTEVDVVAISMGGSAFLAQLDDVFADRDYEVVPYAVLRDTWVGARHAAPVGQEPIWVPGRVMLSHHLVSFNRRIHADLARRLRGEEALGKPGEPPSE